jgi:hypothetical protein
MTHIAAPRFASPRAPQGPARRRLAFLHIPKTAGTAFGAALAQRFAVAEIATAFRMALHAGAADPLLREVGHLYRLIGVGSHLDQDKLDAIAAGLPEGERLFTVTVLREPRERLISQYHHWRRTLDVSLEGTPEVQHEAFRAARDMPLGDFLAARIPFVEASFRDLQARMLCGLGSAELMDDATLAATARQRLALLDVVGTTDALDETMARIAAAYGWSAPDSVRPLNVAPPRPPQAFDDATEAEIERLIAVDRQLWRSLQEPSPALPATALREASSGVSRAPARRFHRPDPVLIGALLDGAARHFTMADALDGQGWHVREGVAPLARWTGPGRVATIRLPAPPSRRVDLSLQLISVLDWAMVEGVQLTLDGIAPLARPQHVQEGPYPALLASFDLPDTGTGQRELSIEVPFTRSHAEIDPAIDDHRQKGIAIGEISLTVAEDAPPATLGALFWDGEAWSAEAPARLAELLTPRPHIAPPPAERHLGFDLPLLGAVLDLVAPDHVWAAAVDSVLAPLNRGTPLDLPAPRGRLAVLATLFEMPMRGAAIATLAQRYADAVLLLPCAEDFRLRALAANPLLRPHLHILGCTNAILVANLAGLRRVGGLALAEAFLLLLEQVAATTPERLAVLADPFGAGYPLRQLGTTLALLETLARGETKPAAALTTLRPSGGDGPPTPAALRAQGRRILALKDSPLALVEPELVQRLSVQLDLLVQAEAVAVASAATVAQESAFRLSSLLSGWRDFGLADNATAGLAQWLRGGLTAPPLYPKPLKPFGEYIDFYKTEARQMALHGCAPGTITTLDTLRGGLDHIVRLNQAAREIEVALRLLGDRHPGEEILWVDAGCSYGVLANAVEPPGNIRGRCRFLGFDFNAPGIEVARVVAGNLGRAHCRFEVGDVAEARALAASSRIHLITAFEVLEHCADPLAVLRDYHAMGPGMLVVGSPLSEAQAIHPAEQHLWGFDASGFAGLVEAAGFALVGVNERRVGRYVGGHDWVTVTATTATAASLAVV